MLQVIQHQSTGELLIEELPAPECLDNGVLVRVANSLISAGTERTSVSKAQSSLVERAMKQPQEVKKVLDSLRKEGFAATLRKVQGALDAYKPLGYSVAGTVVESRCAEFAIGDRVACAGNKYAYHAEYITAPKNLTVRLPEAVPFDEAAYTTLGSIAMQGVRQARVELGASVVVLGLGLLGQITVQLLKAAGCRVVGMDVNETLFAVAQRFGAELVLPSRSDAVRDTIRRVEGFTRGMGADAVIITAATDSNEPAELALELVRKRGRVVVVGAVGMNLPRSPFYEKEVEFTISCSYGPGRYDPVYEEQGVDYPAGYVRWTENRNMASFLDLIAAGRVDVRSMTTHRFPIHKATQGYALVTGKRKEPYSGILLEYPPRTEAASILIPTKTSRTVTKSHDICAVGVIGAGAFAQAQLLPPLKAAKARLVAVSTTTPVSAKSVAERFGFEQFATDAEAVIAHPEVNLVVCASRHDSHARYVRRALEAGKSIFVEKPLCISPAELAMIDEAVQQHDAKTGANTSANVMVGFNRRFSAPFVRMHGWFAQRNEPMSITYRVNAGFVPPEHWIQDPAQGGRIIGESCHFIDCMVFLTGALPVRVSAEAVSTPNARAGRHDTVSITLKFEDGSIGTVHYFANGDASVPKEYCEVFCEGKTAVMKNFQTLELAAGKRTQSHRFDGSKGHAEEIAALLDALKRGTAMPISYHELRAVTRATFAAEESLQGGRVVEL